MPRTHLVTLPTPLSQLTFASSLKSPHFDTICTHMEVPLSVCRKRHHRSAAFHGTILVPYNKKTISTDRLSSMLCSMVYFTESCRTYNQSIISLRWHQQTQSGDSGGCATCQQGLRPCFVSEKEAKCQLIKGQPALTLFLRLSLDSIDAVISVATCLVVPVVQVPHSSSR